VGSNRTLARRLCIYHRQPIYDIEQVEKIANLVDGLYSWDILTPFENGTICTFSDYYLHRTTDLIQVELVNFLSVYQAFTLENHDQWIDINNDVLKLLKEEETKVDPINQSAKEAPAKDEKEGRLKRIRNNIYSVLLAGYQGWKRTQ